jgi:hypothetical protein
MEKKNQVKVIKGLITASFKIQINVLVGTLLDIDIVQSTTLPKQQRYL